MSKIKGSMGRKNQKLKIVWFVCEVYTCALMRNDENTLFTLFRLMIWTTLKWAPVFKMS